MEDSSAPDPLAIVGLGASAGGLQAYTEFLSSLPADTEMAFVVVQHLAAEHESMLATILARSTAMPVIQVDHEPRMQRNTVYVIPPNRSMRLENGKLMPGSARAGRSALRGHLFFGFGRIPRAACHWGGVFGHG